MFTGSIPNFIEGCEVWRRMISNGEVKATEPFRQWASELVLENRTGC